MTTNNLAQHWTPPNIAKLMADLCPIGKLLEPACGNGALVEAYQGTDVTAIEFDAAVAPPYAKVMDFFTYPIENKVDVVLQNPPYLRNRHIPASTRSKLPPLSGHANLAYHFLWKSIDHLTDSGIMVAIVPAEIFHATGAAELNERMYAEGTIPDLIRFTKSPFMPDVSQEVVIFKWVRGDFSRFTNVVVMA
jgi:adenine-specific DNA-methyltransferase